MSPYRNQVPVSNSFRKSGYLYRIGPAHNLTSCFENVDNDDVSYLCFYFNRPQVGDILLKSKISNFEKSDIFLEFEKEMSSKKRKMDWFVRAKLENGVGINWKFQTIGNTRQKYLTLGKCWHHFFFIFYVESNIFYQHRRPQQTNYHRYCCCKCESADYCLCASSHHNFFKFQIWLLLGEIWAPIEKFRNVSFARQGAIIVLSEQLTCDDRKWSRIV